MLTVVVGWQLRLDRYAPFVYWLTVVVVSVTGTLYTDILTDTLGVPLAVRTGVFAVVLCAVFGVWYLRERTLSIHSIATLPPGVVLLLHGRLRIKPYEPRHCPSQEDPTAGGPGRLRGSGGRPSATSTRRAIDRNASGGLWPTRCESGARWCGANALSGIACIFTGAWESDGKIP